MHSWRSFAHSTHLLTYPPICSLSSLHVLTRSLLTTRSLARSFARSLNSLAISWHSPTFPCACLQARSAALDSTFWSSCVTRLLHSLIQLCCSPTPARGLILRAHSVTQQATFLSPHRTDVPTFGHSTCSWRQYSQLMRFTLTPDTDASAGDGASAVIVDWLGAGRIASGERWAFDEYASRFEFVWEEGSYDTSEGTAGGKVKRPRLVEAVRLRRDDCHFLDHPLQSFDAFVTIFACGPQAQRVVCRTKAVALLLAARAGARVRSEEASRSGGGHPSGPSHISLPQTKGQALMGITTDENSGCTVIRLMAEHTEDVYRLLHVCLEPLASLLGAEPYADRVHGAGVFQIVQTKAGPASSAEPGHPKPALTHELNLQQQFALCHLTDATLPVGGFAHSGGIEAAVQLGLLSRQEGDIDGLKHFIKMLALSAFRLQGPFVRSAHRLGAEADGVPVDLNELGELGRLDEDLHAHLAGSLACRASLLQGAGLSRIGRRWCNLSGLPRNGHFASFFGLLCARPLQTNTEL